MNKIAALLLFTAAMVDAAAADATLVKAPASNEQCVKLVAGAPAYPEYPPSTLARKLGGTVRVEMEFTDAQAAPRVRHLDRAFTFSEQLLLNDAVERFAAFYRNTCMQPGSAPVRVRQDFVFVPNDGKKVAWTTPSPVEEFPGNEELQPDCVETGDLWRIRFPHRALDADATGRVVVQVKFLALNEAPEVKFIVPGPHRELDRAVLARVQEYRLKCGKTPVTALQVFSFLKEEDVVLRDMGLKAFVVGSRNATAQPVFFDLDSLGCPFEVRMRYWQPYFRNQVGEVGPARAERRPFLDWLAGLELNLTKLVASHVVGDELTITVPCGKIDL